MTLRDERAFKAAWEGLQAEVRGYLLKFTEPWVAVEIEQDLLWLAYTQRERFTGAEHLRRWAIGRARWRSIDRLRTAKRIGKLFSPLDEASPQGTTSVRATQEDFIATEEIHDAVSRLPPQQRRAIVGLMRGETDEELAKEMDVNKATVRSLRRFGRLALTRLLERSGEKLGQDTD